MRLKIHLEDKPSHSSLVTSLGWTKSDKQYELYSCSDDQTIMKWNSEGQAVGKVIDTPSYATGLDWLPASKNADVFAVSYSDGSFSLLGKSGREEKKVTQAHRGGITNIKWNFEGSAIATTGEDGFCKIWSRSGMLRSTLAQMPQAIYGAAWSADSEQLILCCEKSIYFKSVLRCRKLE